MFTLGVKIRCGIKIFNYCQIASLVSGSPATRVDVFRSRELSLPTVRHPPLQPHQQLHDGHCIPHLHSAVSRDNTHTRLTSTQHAAKPLERLRDASFCVWPLKSMSKKKNYIYIWWVLSEDRVAFVSNCVCVCVQVTYVRVPQDSLLGLILHRFSCQHGRVRACH